MGYRIASFNIRKFSRQSVFSSSNVESKKDLETIARIIVENNFDIVAIQEIFHPQVLKELLERLSGQYAEKLKRGSKEFGVNNINGYTQDSYGYRTLHWEGRWAKPRSRYSDGIAEGYAFIWNRDRIRLVRNIKGELFEPRIADFKGCDELVRPPYLGRFTPINSRYEFRLINTHIVFAKPSKIIHSNFDESIVVEVSDIELRKREFEVLINSVYSEFDMPYDNTKHDRFPKSLTAYTFLLGDYNLNLGMTGDSAARFNLEMQNIKLHNGKSCIVTVNERLTTLRNNIHEIDLNNEKTYLSNNYDHFSYDYNKFEKHEIVQPQVGRILAFDMYNDTASESKFELYKNKVSDHIPIYIDVDVKNRKNEEV